MRISAPSVASVRSTEPTDRFAASESGISRKFLELEHAESATVADVTLLRDTGMLYWFRVLSSALTRQVCHQHDPLNILTDWQPQRRRSRGLFLVNKNPKSSNCRDVTLLTVVRVWCQVRVLV